MLSNLEPPGRILSRPKLLSTKNIVSMSRITSGSDHKFAFSRVILEPSKIAFVNDSLVKKVTLLEPSTSPSPAYPIKEINIQFLLVSFFGLTFIIAFICIIQFLRKVFLTSSQGDRDKDTNVNNLNFDVEETLRVDNSAVQNILL